MDFSYTIIRKKIKKARISISLSGEITVKVPLNFSDGYVAHLIELKHRWIINKLAIMEKKRSQRLQAPVGSIIYLGKIYKLQRNISMGQFTSIDNENKIIQSGQNLENHEKAAKFYKEQANIILPSRVQHMANRHGFNFFKTVTRTMKRTWGTCNSQKIITMNKRLILAPIFVIDAIALHELTHTEIMNHSPKFYERLYQVCPNYKTAIQWLENLFPINYPYF